MGIAISEISTNESKPFVILPFIPPTANHIFVTNWGNKKRFLSKEADSFKKNVISHIAANCQGLITYLNPKGLYRVWYAFFFNENEILNTTYGSSNVKNAAISRYKRMDVENRVKLVSDALSTAIGIDDCQFFEVCSSKLSCQLVGGTPQLHIFLTEVEPTRFGL